LADGNLLIELALWRDLISPPRLRFADPEELAHQYCPDEQENGGDIKKDFPSTWTWIEADDREEDGETSSPVTMKLNIRLVIMKNNDSLPYHGVECDGYEIVCSHFSYL
jgi:hypothetical protein